jgi:uroporphyrinogen-III decarboxylase
MYMNNELKSHNDHAEQLMAQAFAFRNDKPVICMSDVNYWTFGELAEKIPDEYYTDPATSMNYQIEKIKFHMANFPDDAYQPFLHPWFGTGVLASAFGIPIIYNPKSDPAVDMSTMQQPEEIDSLEFPVMGESGIMPVVVKTLDHYKAHCDLPIGITDCQGPLTTALQIVGYDKFCYWVFDDPKRVHKLMDLVTEALISWVSYQKKRAGTALNGASYPLGIKIPDGSGGVWLSDDDSVIMSAGIYKDFVKPYNEKVLAKFDGGVIHYCGDSTQNIDNYANTRYLTAIHNMNMDSLKAAAAIRAALIRKGIVYMAGDFVPSDQRYKDYYKELLDAMGTPEGLVISPYVAPAVKLDRGKYEAGERNSKALALDVMNYLDSLIG